MTFIKNYYNFIIKNKINIKKQGTNTFWMLTTRFLTLAVSFFITTQIANNLGPSEYGKYSYALNFVNLFAFFSSFGVDYILYRDISKENADYEKLLVHGISLRLISSIIAFLCVILFSYFLNSESDIIFVTIILGISFIFQSFTLINYYYQATTNSKKLSLYLIMSILLSVFLKIIALKNNADIKVYSWIYLFDSFTLALMLSYIFFLQNWKKILTLKINTLEIKNLAYNAFPFMLISFFGFVYTRGDILIIKYFYSVKEVGIYDIAIRIAEVSYIIPAVIITSLYPPLVRSYDKNKKLYKKRLINLIFYSLLLCILIIFLFYITSSLIFNVIMDDQFKDSYSIFTIYLLTVIPSTFGTLAFNHNLTIDNAKGALLIYFIAAGVSVILNLLLIPKFGLIGGALTTLISLSILSFPLLELRKPKYNHE